jgi:hypothetical protein
MHPSTTNDPPMVTASDATVGDLVRAIDAITGGRLLKDPSQRNPWTISKTSGIPGKDVLELPGLLVGDPATTVRHVALAMTMTEHDIELAGALGVDALVVHHTIADAASSGGVPLATYLGLYGLSVIECHEALHGLHPGIATLHGHQPYVIDDAFAGVPGMVVMVGRPVAGVVTLGDVLDRLDRLMGRAEDEALLAAERRVRGVPDLPDSVTAPAPRIMLGTPTDPLGDAVLHAFPHTGFRSWHLHQAVEKHPEISTLVLSISRIRPDDDLLATAADLGLRVLLGNSHPYEILENGLPLGFALQSLLPSVTFSVFRERVVAMPLAAAAGGPLRAYGEAMARDHLLRHASNYLSTAAAPAIH